MIEISCGALKKTPSNVLSLTFYHRFFCGEAQAPKTNRVNSTELQSIDLEPGTLAGWQKTRYIIYLYIIYTHLVGAFKPSETYWSKWESQKGGAKRKNNEINYHLDMFFGCHVSWKNCWIFHGCVSFWHGFPLKEGW